MSKQPLSVYESAGEIELGRGEVISTIDLSAHPGSYPVYSSSAVGEGIFGKYGRYMFDEELITWSIDGGGKPFYRKRHKYSVTNVCGFLRINRRDIWNYRYLHATLERLQSGIQFDYQMKAHPSVIRELYKLERIPLEEQNAIADVLDTLDTAIHQTEAIVEKLKQVKQGLLHDLLTRGVNANGELRPSYEEAPHLYQDSPLGSRPKDWEICRVASVLAGIDAGKSPDCQDVPAKGNQWGVLKVGAVHPDGLKLNENKVIEDDSLKNKAYLVRDGDLLISRANTLELVGLVCYVTNHPERLMLSDKTLRLSIKPNRMTAPFLFWQLQHLKTRTQIEIAATGTSGSMKNISQGGVEQLWISRPPIEEQEEITIRLVAATSRYRDEQKKLAKVRELKHGLMDDLLTGRVRVTPLLQGTSQTPKFEP